MRNKKNIAFLIVFLFYIVSFVFGFEYAGKDILYASLPLVLTGSMLYGNATAFIIIAANIPASIALFYILGASITSAVDMIDPFIVLWQCVVALIPYLVKRYTEKKELIESSKIQKKISALMDRLNEERETSERLQRELSDLRLEYERLKVELSMNEDMDPLSDTYNREKTIREINNIISDNKQMSLIYIKLKLLGEINREKGVYEADSYLRKIAESLKRYSEDVGRVGDNEFFIMVKDEKVKQIYDEINTVYTSDILTAIIKPSKSDDIDSIFAQIYSLEKEGKND